MDHREPAVELNSLADLPAFFQANIRNYVEFGIRIKSQRSAYNLSLDALAEETKIAKQDIATMEAGDLSPLTGESLEKLCHTFDWDVKKTIQEFILDSVWLVVNPAVFKKDDGDGDCDDNIVSAYSVMGQAGADFSRAQTLYYALLKTCHIPQPKGSHTLGERLLEPFFP